TAPNRVWQSMSIGRASERGHYLPKAVTHNTGSSLCEAQWGGLRATPLETFARCIWVMAPLPTRASAEPSLVWFFWTRQYKRHKPQARDFLKLSCIAYEARYC